MIVTIDGPASSGKSTTARLVAKRLGFKYIDSGATYRAVALTVKNKGVDPKDRNAVEKISAKIKVDFRGDKLFLDGKDVTQLIRDEEIGKLASLCSTYKKVRENMVTLQRKLADKDNVICEGRDIGTVVFPHADIKIYMDASLKERARRRKLELEKKGIYKSVKEIERDIKLRDLQDMEREHSPLKIPNGAIIIDTTHMSIDEEVDKVIKIIQSKR